MLKYLLCALLLTAAPAFAQTTPGTAASQPKQFCRLYVSLRTLTERAVSIKLLYGQESKKAPVVDGRLAADAAKVAEFDTETQALDYLSSQGWELVGYQVLPGAYTNALFQRAIR